MNTHYYRCIDLFNKLPVHRSIHMRGKAELLHAAASWYHDLLALPTSSCSSPGPGAASCPSGHDSINRVRLVHYLLSHRALDRIPSNDDAVLLVRRPSLQQLSTDATLHHSWTRQHDTSANIIESFQALQTANVFEIPRPTFADVAVAGFRFRHSLSEKPLDVVVHGTDVCLIHYHALACQI